MNDVYAGNKRLSSLLILTERLYAEPASHYRAKILGGPHFIGWGPDTYKSAEIVDAVNFAAVAIVQALTQKRVDVPPPAWRPQHQAPPTPSIAEFDAASLAQALGQS
ncbi:hypothetical protein [Arthrobacter russicus]|uniref:Uncharacterized protein n=1 Tax=Arthrobacter russicus TaxID=172040 RepID=A0ABU1JDU0_9MICC|nr:hypothetical protein [Arthrobacter russicus]MDR6270592.1 hypothetical protein [Arthrobacter russicus]